MKIDLTGQRFGRLTVIQEAGRSAAGAVLWLCRCTCGNESTVFGQSLRRALTRSCGCLRNEVAREKALRNHVTHGYTKGGKNRPEFNAYMNAKKRCVWPKAKEYRHYGGRGIKFLFISFEQFLNEVGPKPSPNLSLDRIDNSGNYEPGNVKWSTWSEQNLNRRPCSRKPNKLAPPRLQFNLVA